MVCDTVVVIMGSRASKTASQGDDTFMQEFTPSSARYLYSHNCHERKLVTGESQMLEVFRKTAALKSVWRRPAHISSS